MEEIHPDLIIARNLIYNSPELKCSELIVEKEGSEYGACSFKINSRFVRFRVAKITPIKIGQFVTLWKRAKNGPIQPYDVTDEIDFFIISVRKDNQFGQFIFPKSILLQHKIISNNGQGGKLAIRVYPPWDITVSAQAKKTQTWQLQYFLELSSNKSIDYVRMKTLYLNFSSAASITLS